MTLGNLLPDGRDHQTYTLIGAAMEVHRILGTGFLERVYQEALAVELERVGVPFDREARFPVVYKGVTLGRVYRPDFVCYTGIVVELKAQRVLGALDQGQLINYLRVSGLRLGLLLNFGGLRLEYQRVVSSCPKPTPLQGEETGRR